MNFSKKTRKPIIQRCEYFFLSFTSLYFFKHEYYNNNNNKRQFKRTQLIGKLSIHRKLISSISCSNFIVSLLLPLLPFLFRSMSPGKYLQGKKKDTNCINIRRSRSSSPRRIEKSTLMHRPEAISRIKSSIRSQCIYIYTRAKGSHFMVSRLSDFLLSRIFIIRFIKAIETRARRCYNAIRSNLVKLFRSCL